MSQLPTTNAINAVLYWPNLTQVNGMSGKYQVDLSQLSPSATAWLSDSGIKVNNKGDERGDYITSKSGFEIEAVDEEGNPIDGLVGNGSQAVVKLNIVNGRHQKFGDWTIASIKKLVIKELVKYEADDVGEDGEVVDYADAL